MSQVLIDAVIATDATKQIVKLDGQDFRGSSIPALKSFGLGSGDVVSVFEDVNGTWVDRATDLDDTTATINLTSVGRYAVSVVMTTAGPATVVVDSSGSMPKHLL